MEYLAQSVTNQVGITATHYFTNQQTGRITNEFIRKQTVAKQEKVANL